MTGHLILTELKEVKIGLGHLVAVPVTKKLSSAKRYLDLINRKYEQHTYQFYFILSTVMYFVVHFIVFQFYPDQPS